MQLMNCLPNDIFKDVNWKFKMLPGYMIKGWDKTLTTAAKANSICDDVGYMNDSRRSDVFRFWGIMMIKYIVFQG